MSLHEGLTEATRGAELRGMKKLLVALGVALLISGCDGERTANSDTPLETSTVDEWAKWEANPEPFGGLEALAKIRKAKESGANSLGCYGNQITDLRPLTGLTKLEKLSLYDNQITDLTPLVGLTKLAHLRLFRNEITDVTPLAGLTNLIVLSLNNNNISDISPLADLTNLMLLGLDGNPIPDSQKAMLRKALPKCEIIF